MDKIQSEVAPSFSREIINYSMVWEDPKLLLEACPKKENLNILSISSAGDNALSLLTLPNSQVTAVDMSKPQNMLLQLKKTAISDLSQEEYLELLGYHEVSENKRTSIYQKIRSSLPQNCQSYWDSQSLIINQGIIHCGRLETYFNKFQELGIGKVFSKQDLEFLLQNKDLCAQQEIIQKKAPLIKSFIEDFFNKKNFSEEGRSEAQYKYVENDISIESHIAKRTFYALQKHLISENSYLYYIFTKSFSKENLPDHLQEENFKKIKKNIKNLTIITSDLETIIDSKNIKFDFFNLSDVFEYVSPEHYEKMLQIFYKSSTQDARIAYWSLFVDRSPNSTSSWSQNQALSKKLHEQDRVWFYKSFNILEKI